MGRIAILKSLILSKLVYLWLLLPNPPDGIIEEIQKSIFMFIWNKKNDRINRKTATQNTELGGIGIPNVENYIKALKLSWVRKLVLSNHKWKRILISCNTFFEKVKSFGTDIPLGLFSNNKFWKDVFSAYSVFGRKTSINKLEQFMSEPLFYNPLFKINNTVIYFENWANKGIYFVKDLVNDQGSFLTFQNFVDKYELVENNFLRFNGFINVLNVVCENLIL